MKQEARFKFTDDSVLEKIIKKCYFDDDNLGKIRGNENYFNIDKTNEIYNDLKGLNEATVKFENEKLIDGIIRCLIKEDGDDIKAFPVSIYCIRLENDLYSFY